MNAATTVLDARSGSESRDDVQSRTEAFWRLNDVSPREGRSTDALSLRFPLQYVTSLVAAAVVMSGAIWAANWGLRSDVRDILTRMDYQQKLEVEKGRLQDERLNALRDSLSEMKRRMELQQYEVQRLNETIQTMKAGK